MSTTVTWVRNTCRGTQGLIHAKCIVTVFAILVSGTIAQMMGDPVITMQPTSKSVAIGANVNFTVRATSTNGPMSFQWQRDDLAVPRTFTNMPSANRTLLNLTSVSIADTGDYRVVIANAGGDSVISDIAHLEVFVAPFTKLDLGTPAPAWGCAWGDYNNDGYPDLLVAEGTWTTLGACSLYANNRDGTFHEVTAEEAGDIAKSVRNWLSPAWGDFDNDGQLDVFVTDNPSTGPARSVLWRNLGDGQFADASTFPVDDLYGNPVLGDYDLDGRLDLLVITAWYEPPTYDIHNALYLNQGDGLYVRQTDDDLYAYRGQLQGGGAGDFDGDGDLDVLVCGPSCTLFENDGAGSFHRVTTGFPLVGGLSITPSWADYDNDGRLDVFIAVYNQTSQLLHNEGNGQWTAMSVGPALETSCGMWADYDNDGDEDLVIVRGQNTATTNLFYVNNGDGTLTSVHLGNITSDQRRSAGCAWADYDNNGFPDLVVTGHNGFLEALYRNIGNGNHWISVKLEGTVGNRSAIGAKVRLQASVFGKSTWQMREISGGNRHQNDLRAHFGLGDATIVDTLRIEWPSGTVQELTNIPANQILTVTEPPRLIPQNAGKFQIQCWINQSFEVQCSSDLTTWAPVTTVSNITGTLVFEDVESDQHDCRYYRVVVP